jgi:hypothetical protein
MGFDIGSTVAQAVGGAVAQIAKVFKADPTVVEQNKFEIEKIQIDLQEKVLEAATREVEAASANIKADASSGDKYTSRARPTFMYVCEFILAWNYIAVPLFKQQPVNLPEPLFWLFGSAILGYTGARTWEKVNSFGDKK